jgi:hypothetical protein
MTVKLNLAPEIYQASQRAKHRRQTATTLGVIICGVSLAVVVVSLIILGGQKVALLALTNSVKSKQAKEGQYSELQAAATAQQHLASWGQLMASHGQFSKFFQVLQSFAPQGVAASNVQIDPTNLITMTGTANSYALVTKFADALEQSNVQVGPQASPTNQPDFSNVQLTSASANGNGGIGFTLSTQMSSEVTSGQ